MEALRFEYQAARRLPGARRQALLGVVASGNLEALFERTLSGSQCQIDVLTSISGYAQVWAAVIADFIERYSPGGLHISIHDGGARPDTVALRLAQGARAMERDDA
jgi:malonate decarboxylase delta subunit